MKRCCRKIAAFCIAAIFLLPQSVLAAPRTSARCAVLMDGHSGRVLWSHNADRGSLIASTTKIMTCLLAVELADPDALVSIPVQAVGVEGSSVYLREGEILSVRELLYGLMLHSGNDAATALAIYCSGSEEAFVAAMNRKAKDLGLDSTSFANPHGLDSDNNFSTATDLAKLTRFAMGNPLFCEVVSTKSTVISDRTLQNHNKLLWRYPGAIGVKTGYTKAAGRILVSCAERDGRRLIAVTIHDPRDWEDHAAMLDYGFEQYEMSCLLEAGEILGSIPVLGGAEEYVQAVADAPFTLPVSRSEVVTYRLNTPVFVFAPVLAGDPAGTVSVLIDGIETAKVPLYWRYSVMEGA